MFTFQIFPRSYILQEETTTSTRFVSHTLYLDVIDETHHHQNHEPHLSVALKKQAKHYYTKCKNLLFFRVKSKNLSRPWKILWKKCHSKTRAWFHQKNSDQNFESFFDEIFEIFKNLFLKKKIRKKCCALFHQKTCFPPRKWLIF